MSTPVKCRFALHLGANALSFVKVERTGGTWRLIDCGDLPWNGNNSSPEEYREELRGLLGELAKQQGIAREPVHISLHNRLCVTRVVTGNREQVAEQLNEITENSHHYLQLGLGDKLIGHTTVPIDESRHHGQVAIIKRGLMETIEVAASQASLELESVDGALTCVCRLTGLARLDSSPLLLVWLGANGAEIGISYKGRLQLNYHAGESITPAQAAETLGKHMKRLQRFCNRYRQVDGSSELSRVLVLGRPEQSAELRERLQQLHFDHVYTLADMCSTQLGEKLGGEQLCSAGVASALGGLLVHMEANVLPTTDVFDKYLLSKPQSWVGVLFRDGWTSFAAAAVLLVTLCCSWGLTMAVRRIESECDVLASSFDAEREQLLELDELRSVLREYERLEARVAQQSVREIIGKVAGCLPEETRLDWCGIDTQGELVLKGTMLETDRTYEVLKALRDLPEIGEVALESVGRTSNYGKIATLFEIHCEISAQSSKFIAKQSPKVVSLGKSR